jgi:hypothetical protein
MRYVLNLNRMKVREGYTQEVPEDGLYLQKPDVIQLGLYRCLIVAVSLVRLITPKR